MAKLFVCSDIHGFYDEFKKSIEEAGFDQNNPDHWLVGLGDYMDRGRQPRQVMQYLRNLPRKVLLRGNHEKLILDCCYRGEAYMHDLSNGTAQTITDLSTYGYFPEDCSYVLPKMKVYYSEMVNYFETEHYIFVHSFIPVINKDGLPAHYTHNRHFEYNPDWRNASQKDWEDATWGNPFDMIKNGLNQTGKTIVFGHWSVEDKWAEDENRTAFDENARFDTYYGDSYIGIDATTAYSKKVNVLVLEDSF
jgi:serine/threonine protein phosphatase 1